MKSLRTMKTVVGLGVAASWIAVAACGSDPVAVEPQVIEDVTFDPSLNIDLTQMQLLANGVYRQDIVAGTGDTLVFGVRAQVDHTGWLTDATVFSDGPFSFGLGTTALINGFEDGVLGMLEGGERLIVIPPAAGYGNSPPPGIPQGAVLVFRIVLDSIY